MNPQVKAGDRIRLIEMPDDPSPVPAGATARVRQVHLGRGQIWVEWEPPHDRRTLMLLPDIDRYELIEEVSA